MLQISVICTCVSMRNFSSVLETNTEEVQGSKIICMQDDSKPKYRNRNRAPKISN